MCQLQWLQLVQTLGGNSVGKILLDFLFHPLKHVIRVMETLIVVCGTTVADYFHIFWDCNTICYWIEIHKDIKNVFVCKCSFHIVKM